MGQEVDLRSQVQEMRLLKLQVLAFQQVAVVLLLQLPQETAQQVALVVVDLFAVAVAVVETQPLHQLET
jgi:uncharacterized membrane protein